MFRCALKLIEIIINLFLGKMQWQQDMWPHQSGKLGEAELKIAKLKLALNGQSLAHIRTLLQAVAKMAVVDFLKSLLFTKH